MKDDGFMKMIHSKLSPETELAVELRCREVWACEDVKQVKSFCVDLMKNHAKSEVVLSNAMMRVVELEAKLALMEKPKIRVNLLYRLRLFIEQVKILRRAQKHQDNHSHRA
tara:strand:- start:583 stop:915 length:333 start_codon:yes stop_codon:yes gene_type:complete